MKKRNIFLLIIPLLLLSSCIVKETANKKENNKVNAVETSKIYAELINSGEYKKKDFYNEFSEQYKKNNDKNSLYKKIEHFNSITGPLKEIERTQVSESSVIFQTDNEFRKSTEIFSYDINGKLSNISLFPGNIKKYKTTYYTMSPVELQRDNLIIPAALTMPVDEKKPKIAILISGLGPRDMNDTIGLNSNKPMEDIAIGLAKNKIASIRYDKSIIHGTSRNSIEDEYFKDFNACYNYIMSLDNIDKNNIFIIAHDYGASLAPTLAKGKNIKGIVLLSGSLKHLSDIIAQKNASIINESNGLSKEEKKLQIDELSKIVNEAKNIDQNSKNNPFKLSPSFWESINKLNLKRDLNEYKGNLLILQGQNDFEIPPDNFYEYSKILNNNPRASFKIYDKLSHIYSESDNNKYDLSIYNKRSKVSPIVINDIAYWINNN